MSEETNESTEDVVETIPEEDFELPTGDEGEKGEDKDPFDFSDEDEIKAEGENEDTETDTDDETEEESDETKEETEEEKDGVEKHTLKVLGEKLELTLDELKQLASKGKGADQKFHQAAESRRKIEEVFKALEENPFATLGKMGKNVKEMAEDFLMKEYELDSMTPEQKETYKMKQEFEEMKRRENETVRQTKEREAQEAAEKARVDLEEKFTSGLTEHGLPANDVTLSKMAYHMESVLNYNKEQKNQGLPEIRVDVSKMAEMVAESLVEENKRIVNELTPEKLEQMYGKDFVKKLQKMSLKKIKSVEDGNRATKPSGTTRRKAPSQRTISDMFKEIESSL
jgi:hypothetical protein